MKELMKMIQKKKEQGKPVDESYKKAKMGMLDMLKKDMMGMMGDDVKGLKKVTVAAPDSKGLKEGMEKAEDLISELAPEKEQVDEEKAAMGNAAEGHDYFDQDMDESEIDSLMKLLEEKKAKKKA